MITLFLLLATLGTTGLGANQDVINTNDSGAGSLRQAVTDVGTGENVSFQPAVAGQTINLSSDLDVSRSMNFINKSGGAVAVEQGAYSMNVTDGSVISIDPDLTFQSTGVGNFYTINGVGSFAIENLNGTVAVNSAGTGGAIFASNDLLFTNGVGALAKINASNSSGYTYVYGIHAETGDVSLGNGLGTHANFDGTITSTATGTHSHVYGIKAGDALSLNNLSGKINTSHDDGYVSGINTGGNVFINGALSGDISCDALSARGIEAGGDLTINGGLSGNVTCTGDQEATGLQANGGVITILNGMSGNITATAGENLATGIHSFNPITISGGLSGSIEATSEQDCAWGIYGGATITINGGLSGTATCESADYTEAIKADSMLTINGDLSGTINATGSYCGRGLVVDNGSFQLNGALSGTIQSVSDNYACGVGCWIGDISITNGLSGTVSAQANTNDASAFTGNDLDINGGISGNVVAQSNTGHAIGLHTNNDLSINGGLSGTITATSNSGYAYGLNADNSLSISGGLSGDVSATTSGSGYAYGVESNNGINIDVLSGTITATTNNANAYGLLSTNGGITITDGLTGEIDATANRFAFGLHSINGTLTINNGLSGTILTNGLTDGFAVGVESYNAPLIVNGGLSGTVNTTSVNGTTYGIYSNGSSLTISGGLSGTVTAATQNAQALGIYAETGISLAGGLSGTVSATSTNEGAFGIFSDQTIDGGTPSTPLLITGNVSANGDTFAIGILGHGLNMKVDSSGTVSALSGGSATSIRSLGTVDDQVELVAGCTIVGHMDLNEGTNDTLTLSGTTSSTTFDGNIMGVETINTTGGTWILNGVVSNNATITISDGTLRLNGVNTFTGDTTVGANGTLGGSGRVTNLINSGTVAPGNSIGTLTVNGNYTQNAGSTLEIEINSSGGTDLLDISGTATINGGTVDVQAESGAYTHGMTYTFLDADGGRTGTFDGVTDNLPFLTAVLLYGTHDVRIFLQGSHTPYIDVAQTFNQKAVAGYLDDHRAGATGDLATVMTQLDTLTAPGARAAFDSLSGELFGSLSTVGLESMDSFLRTLAWRLRARSMTRGMVYQTADGTLAANRDWDDSVEIVRGQETYCQPWWRPNRWHAWADGYGTGASISGNGNASGLGYSVGGVAYGIEDDLDANTLLGFTGGYSQIYTVLDDRSDRGTIDSAQVGVYLHHGNEWGYATGIAAYAHNNYDTLRHVMVGQIDRTAVANYDGNNFSFYIEAGRNVHGRVAHFQPYAALEYIQLHQNGFLESGANSVNLSVGGVRADAFRGLLGTRLVGFFQTRHGRLVSLEGRALWRHEFLDDNRLLDAQFAGQPGGAFTVKGVNVDRDAAILGGGLTFCLADGVKLYANYDLLTSENYTAHAGSGGLMLLW